VATSVKQYQVSEGALRQVGRREVKSGKAREGPRAVQRRRLLTFTQDSEAMVVALASSAHILT
jgi:hypothetical protein